MTRLTFNFFVYPSFEKSLEERESEFKNINKSSLKFTFGQLC